MSTSLLYHGFGLRGYRFVRHRFHDGAIHLGIEHAPGSLCCGRCGSTNVWKAGTVPRQFKTLPIGPRPVFLELAVQRLWCFECGATRQAKLGFAGERVGYTRVFERYALSLLRLATIKDVALHLGVSWDTIKDIQKRNLGRRFGKPGLKQLKRLAIDEISVGHGHRYLTNERARLEEALALNRPLATAYYLKEDLRQFWEQPGKRQAERFLNDWIARASSSGVRMLQQFAQTLQSHRHGLLNYYDYPITTAALEGTNNKIKTLQRQAYGFRDREFFKLRIYALHESRYALVG